MLQNSNKEDDFSEKLSKFSVAILKDRYLDKNESISDLFNRVAETYTDDIYHKNRIYQYMQKLWFMPATPILSNGGNGRGLPISCFLNETKDSLEGILDLFNENVWLASRGGGIGSYWGNLRSIGENVRSNGKTSGVIPFMKVQDSLTLAISQGSLRRGSSAVFLPINHPEIEEFIDLRKPTGGDPNRKALNIHHGVVLSDSFMHSVKEGCLWDLCSPKDGAIVRSVPARDLWIKILTTRIETGEPYIIYGDTVNNMAPSSYKMLGLDVKTSNLCSEITLTTGEDHLGIERTGVCCLSSLNLETFLEWKDDAQFIPDVMRFLDNVLEDFISRAPDSMERARYAAWRERSVGLGVMGFHSFLQSQNIPFDSAMAKSWNLHIFRHIRERADFASRVLAEERGACPDAVDCGLMERFTHKLAIAPTASISIIAGNSSPGIEPYAANSFMQKTLTGTFNVRNKHLVALLESIGQNTDAIWSSIASHEGSVQHLDCLTEDQKAVFKTAYELDQRWIIDLAADRAQYICQAQSVNLFLLADVHKKVLHDLHWTAWFRGLKSLYYCRSRSVQRAELVSHHVDFKTHPKLKDLSDEDQCIACQ